MTRQVYRKRLIGRAPYKLFSERVFVRQILKGQVEQAKGAAASTKCRQRRVMWTSVCVQPLFPRPLDQHWTVGRNVTTARPSNTVRVTAMVARIGVPTTPHSQLPTATVSPSRRTRTVDPRPMESKRILALVVRT